MSDGVCNRLLEKETNSNLFGKTKPKSVEGVKGVRTVRTKVQEEVIFWKFGLFESLACGFFQFWEVADPRMERNLLLVWQLHQWNGIQLSIFRKDDAGEG